MTDVVSWVNTIIFLCVCLCFFVFVCVYLPNCSVQGLSEPQSVLYPCLHLSSLSFILWTFWQSFPPLSHSKCQCFHVERCISWCHLFTHKFAITSCSFSHLRFSSTPVLSMLDITTKWVENLFLSLTSVSLPDCTLAHQHCSRWDWWPTLATQWEPLFRTSWRWVWCVDTSCWPGTLGQVRTQLLSLLFYSYYDHWLCYS